MERAACRAGAFAFVGHQHVVELDRFRERRSERLAFGCVDIQIPDRCSDQPESEQLPVVVEVLPVAQTDA